MISEAKTCQKTNADLFYATKNFIIGQAICTSCVLLITIVLGLGFRRLLLLLSSLVQNPGCETAVHKLPKVDPDDKELVDVEDGESKSCIICLEELSAKKKSSAIVRTPCSHFFHEDCLATWCKNHMDCPICREQVGEADSSPSDVPAEP